ncbi:MAG: 2-octaprenyl-6-methoxyphenyl hydroxylase [Steroidobacteraceae bacterium]|nr:2-octaprenyl-6-methoxyphenyl hydroxylase [Steroidobacteraceae bacterium]
MTNEPESHSPVDAGAAAAPIDCDVAIVGGGMVGASLALALAALPLRVVVVEAVPPEADSQPSFDTRTTALSNGSRRVFQGLGVWDEIVRSATPIRRIHVSDRGHFGFARLSAEEQGVPALGYVAENRAIGAALWRRLRAGGRTELVSPARVTALETLDDRVVLEVTAEGAAPRRLSARLAVAADGAQSLIRRESGVDAARWDYGQTAIIANVVPERFHDYTAYERFTPTGPLAVLPIADGRCVVVYTLAPEAAEAALAQDDAAFLAGLQERFGWRLGRLTKVGRRVAYPLALTRSDAIEAPRVAIIGNAAQGLHPIAGQGFNLGLRDAATLAEVIAAGLAASPDAGDAEVLRRYVEWRRTDRGALIAFTDGLVRLFGNPFGPVRAARSLGLLAFDATPVAKSALARLSLGFAGRLPRLARGLPLVDVPRAAP